MLGATQLLQRLSHLVQKIGSLVVLSLRWCKWMALFFTKLPKHQERALFVSLIWLTLSRALENLGSFSVINVSVGTANEWSAEKTVAALESVGSPVATVIRHKAGARGEGEVVQKPTEEVVP